MMNKEGADTISIAQMQGQELNRRVDLEVITSGKDGRQAKGIFVEKVSDSKKYKKKSGKGGGRGAGGEGSEGDMTAVTSDLIHRGKAQILSKLSEATEKVSEVQNVFTLGANNEIIEQNIGGLWYEKLAMKGADGVTEAEELIVQSETMQNEVELIELWAMEVQGLIKAQNISSLEDDLLESEELQHKMVELTMANDLKRLSVEAIAAVINKSDRTRLLRSRKIKRIADEQTLLTELSKARNELNNNLFEKITSWEKSNKKIFSEGTKLLTKFGDLMENACSFASNDINSEIFRRMHAAGLDMGRVKSSDAMNKLHRKITLNTIGLSPFIQLCNGDVTMVNTTDQLDEPFYVMVRATEGPWITRRTDKPFVKDSLDAALSDLDKSKAAIKSVQSLGLLASILDMVHPGAQRLHGMVVTKPQVAGALLVEKLKALGYLIDDYNLYFRDDETRNWVHKILTMIDGRLLMHARFYYEVHPHVSDLGRPAEWIIGWIWGDPHEDSEEDFPGSTTHSIGVSSCGSVWYNNQKHSFHGESLTRSKCLGVLLDALSGTIILYDEGRNLGSIFGVDAQQFSKEEQAEQGELLRTKHLVPVFALKGRKRTGDGSDRRGGKKGNPKLKKQGSSRRMILKKKQSFSATSGVMDDDKQMQYEGGGGNNQEAKDLVSDIPEATAVAYETIRPAISINFGGYAFAHRPPDSNSCDAYLSIALSENVASETYAERQAALKEQGGGEGEGSPTNESAQVQMLQRKAAFMNSLKYKEPVSWSHFPPRLKLLERSTLILQRATRRMIARRWRRRAHRRRQLMVARIERFVKRQMPIRREIKRIAATNIQRVMRGHRGRLIGALVKKYKVLPDDLTHAATKLQSLGRRYIAVKKARWEKKLITLQLKHVHRSATLIAETWRGSQDRKKISGEIRRNKAANRIQALYRGYISRKQLLDVDAKKKLRAIGISMLFQRKRYMYVIKIQKLFRGFRDRQYARIRRTVYDTASRSIQKGWKTHVITRKIKGWYDFSMARLILKFLKGIKVIY